MHTAIVQFHLPAPIGVDEAKQRFHATAPKYKNLPGLIRKYYLLSEDGTRAGGVYLWETRAAGEAIYDGTWRARVEEVYGAAPQIDWFATPVIVDNLAGAITRAA
jgi:hypothetical protein